MVLRLNYGLGYSQFQENLTGNISVSFPANLLPGRNVVYFFDQDATGNHEVSFEAGFIFPEGLPLPLIAAPDKRITVNFVTTSGSTLVYNDSGVSQLPPSDFLSYFPFNGNGTDQGTFYNPFLAVGAGLSFGSFGVSAQALVHAVGAPGISSQAPIATQATSANRTFAAWVEGNVAIRIDLSDNSTGNFQSASSSLVVNPASSSFSFNSFYYYYISSNSYLSSGSASNFVDQALSSGINHVAVTRTPTGWIFYLNGNNVKTGAPGGVLDNMTGFPSGFNMGNINIAMIGAAGVDDLRIYDRAMSDEEIAALFNKDKQDYGF